LTGSTLRGGNGATQSVDLRCVQKSVGIETGQVGAVGFDHHSAHYSGALFFESLNSGKKHGEVAGAKGAAGIDGRHFTGTSPLVPRSS
jgi:hypothetical protein